MSPFQSGHFHISELTVTYKDSVVPVGQGEHHRHTVVRNRGVWTL